MVKLGDQWYIFYHRQTNNHGNSRQGCAEPIRIESDGSIHQVEMTSCGLNRGPLSGTGTYSAGIACQLFAQDADYPYITQERNVQYITNLKNGAVAGFKYFDLSGTGAITFTCRGAAGTVRILDGIDGAALAEIFFPPSDTWQSHSAALTGGSSHSGLFFYVNTCGSVDFLSFSLNQEAH